MLLTYDTKICTISQLWGAISSLIFNKSLLNWAILLISRYFFLQSWWIFPNLSLLKAEKNFRRVYSKNDHSHPNLFQRHFYGIAWNFYQEHYNCVYCTSPMPDGSSALYAWSFDSTEWANSARWRPSLSPNTETLRVK